MPDEKCPAANARSGNCVFRSDGLYVLGLEAFGAFHHVELYRLAFLQAAESV